MSNIYNIDISQISGESQELGEYDIDNTNLNTIKEKIEEKILSKKHLQNLNNKIISENLETEKRCSYST